MAEYKLNLFLFDGEGAGDGGEAGTASGEPVTDQGEGNPTPEGQPEENPEVEYYKAVKKYKSQDEARIQKLINARFKEQAQLTEYKQKVDPVLGMVAKMLNLSTSDISSLATAIENKYVSETAAREDLPEDTVRKYARIERENAELALKEQARREAAEMDNMVNEWAKQAHDFKQKFPGFDLQSELNDPLYGDIFLRQLKAGNDVETAYRAIHYQELLEEAVRKVKEETVNNIRAKGLRPQENGVDSSAPVSGVTPYPKTKAEREAIIAKMRAGENIKL